MAKSQPAPAAAASAPAEKPTKAATAVGRSEVQFPCAMYKKLKAPTKKWPEGFETKRVESAAQRAALGKEWKDSPAGMYDTGQAEEDDN